MRQRMAPSEIPFGHQAGNRWCPACYVPIREPLVDCPTCDGLLHRNGNEEICDKCGAKRSSSPIA